MLRAGSAFYGHDVIAANRRHHSCFSITAPQNPAVRAAIATIDARAWTPITYTNAIFATDAQRWISDAEVTEIPYTAFGSPPKTEHSPPGLIAPRVPDLNPAVDGDCARGLLSDIMVQ